MHGFINAPCYVSVVHRVKMNARHIICQQINDLVYRVSYARIYHRFIVVFVFLQDFGEFWRNFRPANARYFKHLAFVCHRHNACIYRHAYLCQLAGFFKAVEIIITEKKLCQKRAYTAIYFCFKVVNVLHNAFCLVVLFRVTRRKHLKIAIFFDKTHQITSEFKVLTHGLILDNVPAQGKDFL